MSTEDRERLLADAVAAVLAPLARLCVAQGLPFARAEELFKLAYVRAARASRRAQGGAASRDVSQVSMATGINRREVVRLSAALQPLAVQRPTPATQVFLRWVTAEAYRDHQGRPRPLPRVGPAPSFEALAQSVTRHVHPRSLLAELCRLKLTQLSDDEATVSLLAQRFVLGGHDNRLLGFVGANVGDHLAAAADNIVQGEPQHFEQALFTDELSAASALALRALTQELWAALSAAAVPRIEQWITDDQAQGRPPTRRARIGLFSYHDALQETDDAPPPATPPTPPIPASKSRRSGP